MKYSRKSNPPVSQLLKELESGKHKSEGVQKPNAGAMSALKAVASKNTHKPHKHTRTVTRKAREYAGLGPSDREVLSSFEEGGKVTIAKRSERPKLKVSSTSVSVPPPAGHHWMEEQGRYYLMKGEYKPHPGAVKAAKFKVATHG